MESKEYLYKRASVETLPDILPLFKVAYGGGPDKEELLNKYKTKAFGFENCGYVCYYGTEAVSYVGAIPCYLEKDGEKLLAAQIGDVMTHPKHFRYGLFHKTAAILFDELKKNGFDVIYGFPNLNSKPGFKKRLGWEFTDDLKVSIFDQKCIPFIRIGSVFPFLKGLIESYQKSYLKSKSIKPKSYKSLVGEGFFKVQKSKDLFDYKVKHKPSFFLLLNEKIVWMKFDEMYLYIGDVEDCSFKEFQTIIKQLKRIGFYMGVPHLRFNVSGGSKIKSFLDKLVDEDPNKTFAVGGLMFKDGVSFNDLKFTLSDNDTF